MTTILQQYSANHGDSPALALIALRCTLSNQREARRYNDHDRD